MFCVVSSSPLDSAVGLSSRETWPRAWETKFGNLVIGQVRFTRENSGYRFRRLTDRMSVTNVRTLKNTICSSNKFQDPGSYGFRAMYRSGPKNGGGLGRGEAIGGGGEKSTMKPSEENTMLDLNSTRSSNPGVASLPASSTPKATNIVWQECSVTKEERQKLLGQKGCVIWITGLSGSGKSTLACMLSRALHCRGKLAYVLDGDNIRHGLNKNLGFSAEDRTENIRRVGEVAKLFADAGIICIASLISPYHRDRATCRSLLPEGEFIEIFMNIPLEICEERDVKGLYKLARAGKIKGFTGIDDPYEPPSNSEIVVQPINGICPTPKDTEVKVVSYLEEKGFI